MPLRLSTLLLAVSLASATTALAQVQPTQQAQISPAAQSAFAAITAHALVKKGLAFLEADDANTLNDQKTMTVIPAPPFKEQKRAEYYRAHLQRWACRMCAWIPRVTPSVCGVAQATAPS